MRIGLIHYSHRRDTWCRYYSWQLRKLGHEVYWLCESIGPRAFQFRDIKCDLYLRIDDSLGYEFPDYKPLIYLCSDTHVVDGVTRGDIAEKAGFTFVAQKNATQAEGGIGDEWLPHAAWFTNEHSPGKDCYDVSSCMTLGNGLFADRTRIAQAIREKYPVVHIGRGAIHEEMASIYANSLVVWHHSVNNDIAMRHFEAAAIGTPVVSSRIEGNGMEEVFADLVYQYDDEGECMVKIDALLSGCYARGGRGRDFRKLVLAKHMYANRVERVLEVARGL